MREKNIQIKKIFDKIIVPNKLFIVMFVLLNLIIIYNTYESKTRIDTYFRIHVLANSDSIQDQLLKYKVAENVNEYIKNITANVVTSKEEAKSVVEKNIQNVLEVCNKTIKDNGYNSNVYANIGKIYYDEKYKDEEYMTSGIYDSLQIVIGEGNGQNWWSLIFPYSYDGVVNKKDETKTDDTSHISTYDIVSSDDIEIKFGILDLISKIFHN